MVIGKLNFDIKIWRNKRMTCGRWNCMPKVAMQEWSGSHSQILPLINMVGDICGPAFFTCVPTQSTRLAFIGEKKLVLEKLESPLILFYFRRKNKTRKKTLKKWLHSFWKNMSLKKHVFEKPEFRSGDRLLIGKVPLRGSIPLSHTKVSID